MRSRDLSAIRDYVITGEDRLPSLLVAPQRGPWERHEARGDELAALYVAAAGRGRRWAWDGLGAAFREGSEIPAIERWARHAIGTESPRRRRNTDERDRRLFNVAVSLLREGTARPAIRLALLDALDRDLDDEAVDMVLRRKVWPRCTRLYAPGAAPTDVRRYGLVGHASFFAEDAPFACIPFEGAALHRF